MIDQDLDQRLRQHYRSLDPGAAPRSLAAQIDEAIGQRRAEPTWRARNRLVPLTALAAIVILVTAVALRLGGQVGPVGSSPTPVATPSPSTGASESPDTTAAPSPAGTLPPGTLPPIRAVSWSALDIQPIADGPKGATSVAVWSGGYLALGTRAGTGAQPVNAWLSSDGRTWVALPTDAFGLVDTALAISCPDEVLAFTQNATGQSFLWRSTDGQAWSSTPADNLLISGSTDVACTTHGIAALFAGAADQIFLYSPDLSGGRTVALPGPAAASARAVAAFDDTLVAVGDPGSTAASPIAWTSKDGVTWTASTVESIPGDAFTSVIAGANGLIAESTQPQSVPGLVSYWTSADGTSWARSTADPLGVQAEGQGVGSALGGFVGDGTHLLGFGDPTNASSWQYWSSLDGTSWTRLALSGDATAAVNGQASAAVLRDGVLFLGLTGTGGGAGGGAWFGSATP